MKEDKEAQKHYFDISRIKKNMFSNPFNFRKLGIPMAQTCYHRNLQKNYKKFPEEFLQLRGKKLICLDPDCYPLICHKKQLESFLKKINGE
jgi:hypothetical protein